jgi:hypothetical protein
LPANARQECRFFAPLRITIARLVILNPSPVILNPSDPVILSKARDLILLRVDSEKSLRAGSVKDL